MNIVEKKFHLLLLGRGLLCYYSCVRAEGNFVEFEPSLFCGFQGSTQVTWLVWQLHLHLRVNNQDFLICCKEKKSVMLCVTRNKPIYMICLLF